MVFYVYINEMYKEGEFFCYYIGQTDNLERRKKQHINNIKKRKRKTFTGRFDDSKLRWYEEVPTRDDAVKLEKYLKSLKNPKRKESYMEKFGRLYDND